MRYIILVLSMSLFGHLSFAQGKTQRNPVRPGVQRSGPVHKSNPQNIRKQPSKNSRNIRTQPQKNNASLSPKQRKYIQERQDVLDKKLDLSPSQRRRYDALKKDTRIKVEQIKNNPKLKRQAKENQLRYIIKDAEMKRNELLTPEQRKILNDELEFRKMGQ